MEGTEFVRLGKTLADTGLARKFPDLYNAAATAYSLKGAEDTKTIISTFRIPEAAPFGSSELKSLEYYFYTSSITIGNSLSPIRLAAYKFKNEDDVTFDSSKLTSNTGLVKGTTPVIEANPLFFSTSAATTVLEGYSENFTGVDNGLIGDADYKSMGRKSYVLLNPYLEASDFMSMGSRRNSLKRVDGQGTLANHFSLARLKQHHGTIMEQKSSADEDVVNSRTIITISSHNSEKWKTKVNRDDEDYKWVPKIAEFGDVEYNVAEHWIKSSEVLESDDKLYGDEVTPQNSIFTYVRGSKEIFEQDDQNSLDAEAAAPEIAMAATVKYISEDASVGQCAQFFAYHSDNVTVDKYDPLGSLSDAMNMNLDDDNFGNATTENGSDAVAVIKHIPAPYNIGVPIPGVLPHVSESGNVSDEEEETSGTNMRKSTGPMIAPGVIQIDFTIPELETAFATGSGSLRYSMVARAFTIMVSNIAPQPATQRFRDYLDVVTGKASGSASWPNNGIGITFIKDKNGTIRAFGLDEMDYSTSNTPTGWSHDYYIPDAETDDILPIPEESPLRMVIVETDCLDRPEWRIFIYQKEDVTVGEGGFTLIGYNQMQGHLGTVATAANRAATAQSGAGALGFGDGKMDASVTGSQNNHAVRHMSFWLTNHINQKSGDNDGNIDDQSDCRSKINIDSINFFGYNNAITNASILTTVGEGKYISPLFSRSPATIPYNTQAYYGSTLGTDISGDDKNWLQGSIPTTLDRTVNGVMTPYGSGVQNAGSTNLAYNYNAIGPGGTVLCWGFSHRNQFDANPSGGYGTSANRYIFLQDFLCVQLKKNDPIDENLMMGGYTIDMESVLDDRVPLGCQNYPVSISPQVSRNALLVGIDTSGTPGTTADDIVVDLDLGASSFTEKGFIQLKFNSANDGPTGDTRILPAKRECVYTSARILRAVREGGNVIIQVDCTDPFACAPSQEYMVYLMGAHAKAGTNYATDIKVLSASKSGKAVTITLDWDGYNDNTDAQVSLIQDHLIPHLWIGPVAYWMWIYVPNFKDSQPAGTARLTWNGLQDYADTYNSLDALKALPSKSYGSCMVTSTQGTPGATFNEWMYSNSSVSGGAFGTTITGLNEASWDLSLSTKEGMFDLQDFGFGDFQTDEDSNTGFKGGHVGLAAPNLNAYSKLRMPAIIETASLKPNDFVALYMSLKDTSIDHSIDIRTRNSSTVDFVDPISYEPIVAAKYFDAIPAPMVDFKVKPYAEDAYIPEYTWSVSDDDLWYGMMHVDSDPIYHQYHKAILYLPLYESSTAEGVVFRDNPASLLKVYNFESGEKSHQHLGKVSGAMVAGTDENAFVSTSQFLTDPQGLAGNTCIFGGSRYQSDSQLYGGNGVLFGRGVVVHPIGTDALKTFGGKTVLSAGFTPTAPTDEFSLSMHITPDSKPPAPYILKADNIAATFSLNQTGKTFGTSTTNPYGPHIINEALDTTETEIDVHRINVYAPQYETGKTDGSNAMRTDYGTDWITTGEVFQAAGAGDYDIDDSMLLKCDDEIMKITAVNPGTLTQITKNSVCTIDVSDNQIDLASHGFITGTPVKFTGITNATNISNNVTYYVSSTSNVSGAFRLSAAENGSGVIAFTGGDDSGVIVKAALTLDDSYYNASTTHTYTGYNSIRTNVVAASSELITGDTDNRTFNSASGVDWVALDTTGTDVTISIDDAVADKMQVTTTTDNEIEGAQLPIVQVGDGSSTSIKAGHTYKVSMKLDVVTGTPAMIIGLGGTLSPSFNISTTETTYEQDIIATNNTGALLIYNTSTTALVFTVEDVSVKETTTPSLTTGDRIVLFGGGQYGFTTETMVLGDQDDPSPAGWSFTAGSGDGTRHGIKAEHTDYKFDRNCSFVTGDRTVTHSADARIVQGMSISDADGIGAGAYLAGTDNVVAGAYITTINSSTSFEMSVDPQLPEHDATQRSNAGVTFDFGGGSRGIDKATAAYFTALMHIDTTIAGSPGPPSDNGEIVVTDSAGDITTDLKSITKIYIREVDENGRSIVGDDAAIGVPDVLPATATGKILIELASDTTKFVWFHITDGPDTSGSGYQMFDVEWHGGATGHIENTFAHEADVLWSLKSNYSDSAGLSYTSKPCFLATGDTYSQANRIYGGTGGGTVLANSTNSYYCDKLGFWKLTGRSITVERGFGGTTAAAHTEGTPIYRISDGSPLIGGITLADIDDVDDSTGVPIVYDSDNNDQMWRFALLQIGNEKMMTGDMNPDSSWQSSGWARAIENTDWEVHDADSITVIPRNFIFHSFTDNTTITAGVNPTSSFAAPVLSVYMDSDGKINVIAYIENQSYKYPLTLKSKTIIPFDGLTPTHLGVVFDSQIPSQNLKLFLNGKLEDATGFRAATGTINNLQNNADGTGGESLLTMGTVCIGGMPHQTSTEATSWATNGFDGAIEEVCIWNRAVYFVEPTVGTYKHLKPYKELESGQSEAMSHSVFSKLFIKDYHNIRGKSGKEVRSSALVSIRKAAFTLDTT